MSSREFLIVLLLAAIGVSGVAWFLATHEQYTDDIWVGYRGEARRNPWLAAQRFLEKFDLPARELRALPALRNLPADATLIIPESHHTITDSLRRRIVDWVEQGGRLIVEGEYAGVDDPLVSAFGVRREEIEYDELEDEFDEEADEESDGESTQPEYDSFTLPGARGAATVVFETHMRIFADDAWFRATGKYGTYLLAIRRGRGMVVVVNDLDYLRNNRIGTHDHAQFLLDLFGMQRYALANGVTASTSSAGPVLFFNQPGKLSLFDWLKKHAWAPMTGAAAVLLLWLWRVTPRFGPVAPDPERTRRRLLDHLRASGRFLWTHGHAKRLVEASREACLRRIARTLPDFLSASTEARTAQLVHVLGITSEQANRILQPQDNMKMLQFLHTIRLYQSVYARLTAYHPKTDERPT